MRFPRYNAAGNDPGISTLTGLLEFSVFAITSQLTDFRGTEKSPLHDFVGFCKSGCDL
jgi:hypothetical protein